MADSPLQRVTSLIRLSASDNENEARSAASEACRLIRQHGLVVVRSIEAGEHVRSPAPPAGQAVDPKLWWIAADVKQKTPPKVDKKRMRPIVMASPVTTPIQMKAKFAGRCEDCQRAYAQGDPIWYRRGVGAVHGACEPEALV
jgi:hypothetical protein